MLTHMGWDYAALQTLGQITGQKIIKTLCDRRVAFGTVAGSESAVTCPRCQGVIVARENALQECQALLTQLQKENR